jgi:hypothetical protein
MPQEILILIVFALRKPNITQLHTHAHRYKLLSGEVSSLGSPRHVLHIYLNHIRQNRIIEIPPYNRYPKSQPIALLLQSIQIGTLLHHNLRFAQTITQAHRNLHLLFVRRLQIHRIDK